MDKRDLIKQEIFKVYEKFSYKFNSEVIHNVIKYLIGNSIEEIFKNATNKLNTQELILNLNEIIEENKLLITIGDIHGDLSAIFNIFSKYSPENDYFLFVGDYVDRGPYSFETILFIAILKILYEKNIFILAGNHEIFPLIPFSPADFWRSSNYITFKKQINNFINNLSLLAIYQKTCFVHALFPEYTFEKLIKILRPFKTLKEVFKKYPEIIYFANWSDIYQKNGYKLTKTFLGRPAYGIEYFLKFQENTSLKNLIRGHQPDVKGFAFDNKVLTLLTSSIYYTMGFKKGRLIYVSRDYSSLEDLYLLNV